mmetsp:Transcript_16757/g.52803  ORF Transcript_16757/g.52803 Transcript_16757/m.52803 type:complete len:836 (-) Transcript_16757:64-2571(-)
MVQCLAAAMRRWILCCAPLLVPVVAEGVACQASDGQSHCLSSDLDADTQSSGDGQAYMHLIQQAALHVVSSASARNLTAPLTRPALAETGSEVNKSAGGQRMGANKSAAAQSTEATSGAAAVRTAAALATTETTTTTADTLGLTLNAAGDMDAFISASIANVATMVFCVVVFALLRVHYPLIYSRRVLDGTAPSDPDTTSHFSWIGASLSHGKEDWIASCGMDNAMLLEFSQLCMKICLIAGGPMLLIMGPMHLIFGGNAAGADHLSYLSFGNVENGSWLYWIHAFIVWGVVLCVSHCIMHAQNEFVHLRAAWLKHMAEIRANTVLVMNIGKKCRSDATLKEFFEQMFPGPDRVKDAYVAKDTKHLPALEQAFQAAKENLFKAEKAQKDTGTPTMVRASFTGSKVEAVPYYKDQLKDIWKQMKDMRSQVLEDSKTVGDAGGNCSHGFVTFYNRADAEIALRLDAISKDQEKWDIQIPPEPEDVLWADLTQDPTAEAGRAVTGYLLIIGLYVAYMPLVIGITNIAQAVNMGPLQSSWEGLAPTMGLTLMVAFLPTFILLILKFCFTLKADASAQHKLQLVYFYFQLVFVILVAAIGQNVTKFTTAVLESPVALFSALGSTMPFATHFYMNLMVVNWSTHCMNILRYVTLGKYLSFRPIFGEDVAATMAEPEDQDYYGLGSRSARWTINMLIAVIFGTLCPPMWLLTFLNFAVCRLIYGYLIPFAETRKPDLGGFFWVSKLRHMLLGNILYVVLMTGVLFQRATSSYPAWIAASCLFYVAWSINRFDTHFSWEKLPFKYIVSGKDEDKVKRQLEGRYIQPELDASYREIEEYMRSFI